MQTLSDIIKELEFERKATEYLEGVDDFRKGVIQTINELLPKLKAIESKYLPKDCQSKEDGICRLPIGSCQQCNSEVNDASTSEGNSNLGNFSHNTAHPSTSETPTDEVEKQFKEKGNKLSEIIGAIPDLPLESTDDKQDDSKLIVTIEQLVKEFERNKLGEGMIAEAKEVLREVKQSIKPTSNDESKGNFAIAFATWAMYDPQAKAYQEAGITAGDLLRKYKSRPYIDTNNPHHQ